MIYFVSTQINCSCCGVHEAIFKGLWRILLVWYFCFLEKMGTAMASHLRGIQGQCNIKKCVEPWQKSDKLTQWGWCGMTWTTEQKLFSNLRPRYLMHNTEPQLPCPNFKTQSTDMPARCQPAYWPCIGRHIGRHVGRHLVRCWSTYWSTCWPTVDQYGDCVVTDTRLTYKDISQ